MLSGILASAAFAVCAAKFITHRVCRPDIDRLFLKLHAVCGMILPAAAGMHTVKMLKSPHRLREAASGFCIDAGILGLLGSHFFAARLGDKAMSLHRFSTVFTGAGIAAHGLTHR